MCVCSVCDISVCDISVCDISVCDIFLDGYCSTIQDLLDWFEVDLGFTKLCLFR